MRTGRNSFCPVFDVYRERRTFPNISNGTRMSRENTRMGALPLGMGLVLSLRDRRAGDRLAAGDKAAGLHLLLTRGFPVPPGFCILPYPVKIGSAESLRGLPPDFHRAVSETYRRLGGLVAVRSAAARSGCSPAILGLNGEESTVRAVARCMTATAGRDHLDGYRPVVVQRLADAVASGTAFSRNPRTGDDTEIVITGRWGISLPEEPAGAKNDLFCLRKYPLYPLHQEIALKVQEIRAGPVGLVHRPLAQERRRIACLAGADLLRLGRLIREVEEKTGYPVEVAWALTGRGFQLLQLGPAPAPPEEPFYMTPEAGGGQGETLRRLSALGTTSGVLSPLAWDLISRGSRVVLDPLLASIGERTLAKVTPLSFVAGRVYCNVTACSLALEQALRLPRGTIESLAKKPDGPLPAALFLRLCLRPVAVLNLRRQLSPGRLAPLLEEMVEETTRFLRILRENHDHQKLAATIEAVDSFLLRRLDLYFRLQLVSRRLARILERLRRWCGPEGVSAGYRLLGQAGLDGPGAGRAVWGIAQGSGEDFDPQAWERFRETFGHWCEGALDPANPRWGDDPGHLKQQWRSFLASAAAHAPRDYAAERGTESEEAAAWLDNRLSGGWGRIVFWRRLAPLRWRERFVAHWTMLADAKSALFRLVHVYRLFLLRAGEALCARGILTEPGEIFLLRLDEIQAALGERPDAERLRTALKHRATARDLYQTIVPPARIDGPYKLAEFTRPAGAETADLLTGEGVSPGVHRGTARIIGSPAQTARMNPGDVIVATSIDTGSAPLFLAAGAVVTELGGRLSDAAVLAREFGRPAVVGAARAGSAITDGDLVEVDGDRGLVRIISRYAPADPPGIA